MNLILRDPFSQTSSGATSQKMCSKFSSRPPSINSSQMPTYVQTTPSSLGPTQEHSSRSRSSVMGRRGHTPSAPTSSSSMSGTMGPGGTSSAKTCKEATAKHFWSKIKRRASEGWKFFSTRLHEVLQKQCPAAQTTCSWGKRDGWVYKEGESLARTVVVNSKTTRIE